MLARLLRIAALLVVTAVVFIGCLRFLEYAFLYHPHSYRANYSQLISGGVVELPFKISTGSQTAFYVPPHDSTMALPGHIWVIFCGNGSLALDWLALIEQSKTADSAFLLIDYPGYGKSEGRPNVVNTRAAADGALLALATRLGVETAQLESRLNTMGHSLGSAAALDFAAHRAQVHRIILLAPFTSVREEATLFIGKQLSYLLGDNYDNREALRQLAQRQPAPRVVIFHGLADGMIPFTMGRELATEFPTFVSFHGIPGATHDSIVSAAQDQILALIAGKAKE